jgi:hypothetical protein
MIKVGDKVKYIGDAERFHGEIGRVTAIFRNNKFRVIFDNPLFNGAYRANGNSFIGLCSLGS